MLQLSLRREKKTMGMKKDFLTNISNQLNQIALMVVRKKKTSAKHLDLEVVLSFPLNSHEKILHLVLELGFPLQLELPSEHHPFARPRMRPQWRQELVLKQANPILVSPRSLVKRKCFNSTNNKKKLNLQEDKNTLQGLLPLSNHLLLLFLM
jgi:hypothetical protein